MKPVALPLSLAAALLVGACASSQPDRGATASAGANVATQEIPYQPGTGVVQSVSPVPTASTGATKATEDPNAQRLGIRMENGQTQYVDVVGANIPRPGDRVQLTPDRKIIKQ